MFRSATSGMIPAALAGVAALTLAGASPAAPPGGGHAAAPPSGGFHSVPPIPFTPPTTHYVNPPSYTPGAVPGRQSYYQQHYNNGVYPHSDYYSYYDPASPYQYSRKPTYGTAADLGGAGGPSLAPLYPDEYNYAGGANGPAGAANAYDRAIGHITVRVPEGAQVIFDGYKTKSTGTVRHFETPPLKPGQPYNYEVEARWEENGKERTQKQTIPVSAGSSVQLDFPLPPGGPGEAGGAKPK